MPKNGVSPDPSYDVIDKCKDIDGNLWTMRVTVREQSWTGVPCRNQKAGRLSAAKLALPVVRGWVQCGGEVDVKEEEKDMNMKILLDRYGKRTVGKGAAVADESVGARGREDVPENKRGAKKRVDDGEPGEKKAEKRRQKLEQQERRGCDGDGDGERLEKKDELPEIEKDICMMHLVQRSTILHLTSGHTSGSTRTNNTR